jgi:hypothetical protein
MIQMRVVIVLQEDAMNGVWSDGDESVNAPGRLFIKTKDNEPKAEQTRNLAAPRRT